MSRHLRLGERALEARAWIAHKWVLQEHHWRLAALYRRKGDRTNEREHVVAALREFHNAPVVLEPILFAGGLVEHDPIRDLPQRGITDGFLRERHVAPAQNTPREIPLLIGDAIIKRIVKTVLRGG